MPAESFLPPLLLRNRHLQSIAGSLPPQSWLIRRRAAALLARSRPMLLECGGGVRLLALHSPPPPDRVPGARQRLAVLLHGWEGCADSPYVLSAAALLSGRGFGVLRLNLRDHGGSHALNAGLFHSCRLPEVVGAVAAISRAFPDEGLYLGGFSLGGNFMLRVAADECAPAAIAGAAAVSPVLDPAATLRALEQGLAVYRRYFVRRWTRSLRAKQRAWPEGHDLAALARTQDLRQMTADLVQRCTEFPSLDAYLAGYAITGARLARLRFPASLLLADDDPIIPATDLARLAAGPRLSVLRTRHVGHCGFMPSWGRHSFADRFLLTRFESFEARAP